MNWRPAWILFRLDEVWGKSDWEQYEKKMKIEWDSTRRDWMLFSRIVSCRCLC